MSLSGASHAALIEADWHAAGDAKITRDTASGLDWLDMPETVGISHQSMLGMLTLGGAFGAFRYPTITELRGFFTDAGITNIDPSGDFYSAANAGPVLALMGLVGETTGPGASPGFRSLTGVYGPTSPELQATLAELLYCPDGCLVGSGDSGAAKTLGLVTNFNSPHSYIGHWLVRETPIPEPGTVGLMLVAVVGLIARRERAAQ